MTANQIPRPGGGLTHGMLRDTDEHRCTGCWRDGGPGHHLVPIEEDLPAWTQPAKGRLKHEPADENPVIPVRRTCSYWSARGQKHCSETYEVSLFPGIGPRCEAHDPELLNALYRAQMERTTTKRRKNATLAK